MSWLPILLAAVVAGATAAVTQPFLRWLGGPDPTAADDADAVDFTALATPRFALLVGVLTLVEFTMSFPQLAAFENTLGNYVKNSLILAACAPVHLLGILAAWAVPWGMALTVTELFLRFGYLYMLWGLAFPAWLTVKLLNLVFKKTNQSQPTPAA